MSRGLALCAAALTHTSAWASTLFVGGGGAPSYPDIQSAVNAAQPGDVIVVAAGTYAGFTLEKPLCIVAPDGALVRGSGPFGWGAPLLADLRAPGLLRLIGLQFLSPMEACRIGGIAGSNADIEECSFGIEHDPFVPPELLQGGLSVVGLDALRARSTSFIGRSPLSVRGEPRCDVALADCSMQSLQGTCTRFSPQGYLCSDGRPAVSALQSDLELVHCTLRGGNGASPYCSETVDLGGNDGGDALEIEGAGTRLRISGRTTLTPGTATQGCSGHPSGTDGRALYASAGVDVEIAADTAAQGAVDVPIGARLQGPSRPRLRLPARPLVGGRAALELIGTATGPWEIYVGSAPFSIRLDGFDGTLRIDPQRSFVAALLAPLTRATITFPIPNDPALFHVSLWLQGLEATGTTPPAYFTNVAGVFLR